MTTRDEDAAQALANVVETEAVRSQGMVSTIGRLMSIYVFLTWPPNTNAAHMRLGHMRQLVDELGKQLDDAQHQHDRECPHGENCQNHRRTKGH